MKHFLFFFLFCPFLSVAQIAARQSEISVSCGVWSLADAFGSESSGSGGPLISAETGAYSLTYRYYISKRFAIGATAGIQKIWGSTIDDSGDPLNNFIENYNTIAIDILYNYVNKKSFRLYSYIEPGESSKKETTITTTTNNYGYSLVTHTRVFNLEYVPIGISFGKKLSGFFEVGFGFKGFFNGGISFRFPSKKGDNKVNMPQKEVTP